MKKRILVVCTTAVLSLSLLAGCGIDEESPPSYAVGGDEVVSLDSVMDEGAAILVSIQKPTEAAIELGKEEYTYRYSETEKPAELAENYVSILRGEEQGFTLIDEENRMAEEEPDFESLTGTVILGKAAASEEDEEAANQIFRVIVAWSEYSVAIQVSHQEGEILPPLEPEPEDGNGESGPTAMSEQMEYFTSLSPSLLGLPGDSMEEYRIYPVEGWVRVNGVSCRQMNVYLLELPESTNTFLGTYYLSSDLQELYVKSDTGSISKIDLG